MWSLPAPITSRTNARVKVLRASLSGEARHPGDLLGLEGEHLIQEAHAAGYSFEALYLREGSEALERRAWLREVRAREWVVLSREVFDSAVETRSPQGLAGTCVLHELRAANLAPANTLVLERLQDPGNLGTLLRSAESFGFSRIMVSHDTANQWNPKVVRAGAGAVLRTPVQRGTIADLLKQLRAEGTRIFAAVAHLTSFAMAAPHGVLRGRHREAKLPEEERRGFGDAIAGPLVSRSFDADFESPCAILVGNEGAGLSAEALALADEQVIIPGTGSNKSLNAAVAGSVLMYEAMRQIPLRTWARQEGLRL